MDPKGGGDASDADCVLVSKVVGGAMRPAFDNDAIVRGASKRLRATLEFTSIVAKCYPPDFTISDLRKAKKAA